MSGQIILSRQAVKDAKKIAQAGLKPQAEKLLQVLTENPYMIPPPLKNWLVTCKGFIPDEFLFSIVWFIAL